MMKEKLNQSEKIRYARHFNIPDLGEEGQLKLKASSVLVAGCGGLGSASSLYLAAAGIGRLGLVDSDKVDLSNLQRQVIHSMESIGRAKVDSAKERINGLNPNVKVNTFHDRIQENNARSIIKEYDIVVDATDNFDTRYVLNAACFELSIPFVYGAIFQFSGQMSLFNYKNGPCFQCVFQHTPTEEFKDQNRGVGVVGALPGVIGSLQAIEVIKLCAGIGRSMTGRLLIFNGLDMDFKEITTMKNKQCPVCAR